MQIVIDIPKEDYEFIYDEFAGGDMPDGKSLTRTTLYAIANGTILPKGHGRLVDADELKKHKYHDNDRFENAVAVAQIDWADTIIEADKEVENADSD